MLVQAIAVEDNLAAETQEKAGVLNLMGKEPLLAVSLVDVVEEVAVYLAALCATSWSRAGRCGGHGGRIKGAGGHITYHGQGCCDPEVDPIGCRWIIRWLV